MEKFKFVENNKTAALPNAPGVYALKKGQEIFYIGKAGNIKKRVAEHFKNPSWQDALFMAKSAKIGFVESCSEIEALILEANLIKIYQPKYNIVWKDDKNYFYVAISKNKPQIVFVTHQPQKSRKFKKQSANFKYIGPFVDGNALKKTLKVLRRIFPYYVSKKHPKIPCLWCHLELCPGPNPNIKEYKKNIKNLTAFLEGKKKSVLKKLRKEMFKFSSQKNFERAAEVRDKIFALEKILAHYAIFRRESLAGKENYKEIEQSLRKILGIKGKIKRIEAYDVSNIQGKLATGSMVTFINGRPDKNFYRKFKIKISGKPDDVAMLKEVLKRRFSHSDWQYPDLILIDGGVAQLRAVLEIKKSQGAADIIPVISLAKRKNELFFEKWIRPLLLKKLPKETANLILQLRDESHRFAKKYHLRLRKFDLGLTL